LLDVGPRRVSAEEEARGGSVVSMLVRLTLSLALLASLGCARKADGLSADATGADESTQTSLDSSGGSSSESETDESESESETGEDEPFDACPASPVLTEFRASVDEWNFDIDYPEEADWSELCTVTAHAGALASGESITLACVDAEGQAVEHVIELQAKLADADQPTAVPVAVGESVRFTLWSRVWFSGGAAWALRDPEQLDDIRLLYYASIELPDPADSGFSPTPAFVEPLEISIQDGLCDVYCPVHEGVFVPSGECACEIELGLHFVHGPDTTLIQNGSASPIGGSMFAFIETAKLYPHTDRCTDHPEASYTFLLVAR
jgi:hypothetical protein